MKPLDMKDIAIIDAFPAYDCERRVLDVGCGDGRIDFHLAEMGYKIYAFDSKPYDTWRNGESLTFHIENLFKPQDLSPAPIVICSQVLEHLKEYNGALANLVMLAEIRLIITVPYKFSFSDPGHCNHWTDGNVDEFKSICHPYAVSISKIRTKPKDAKTDRYNYLIIVDKRQNYTRGPQ